jgi:2,4-diaminopentanoate dehydrogenase
MMTVNPGEVAAVRVAVEGFPRRPPGDHHGHVNRLTSAAAPHRPVPPECAPGVHRVVIQGAPGIEIDTHVGNEHIDHNDAGVLTTAHAALNAIEVVCAASPGLVSLRDLPVSPVRGLMP